MIRKRLKQGDKYGSIKVVPETGQRCRNREHDQLRDWRRLEKIQCEERIGDSELNLTAVQAKQSRTEVQRSSPPSPTSLPSAGVPHPLHSLGLYTQLRSGIISSRCTMIMCYPRATQVQTKLTRELPQRELNPFALGLMRVTEMEAEAELNKSMLGE